MKLLTFPLNDTCPIKHRITTILDPMLLAGDDDHVMTILEGLRDYFNDYYELEDIEAMNVMAQLDSAIFWYQMLPEPE